MTSLTDVYDGNVGRVASRRQQLVGTGLFLAGVAAIVGAIAVATTGLGVALLGRYGGRELAGTLAGLGLPTLVLGLFAVLPAHRRVRAAAGIGTSVAVLGVALFRQAYPYAWVDAAPLFALVTTAVYVLGVGTLFWALFVALATFKTRTDPGGTARMEITREGHIELVEEARSVGAGTVGLFGREPDGGVETQTNRASRTTDHDGASIDTLRTGSAPTESGGSTGIAGDRDANARTADGGSAAVGADPADDDFLDAADERGHPDEYCGNCRHFEYVMVDGEPTPYCALHNGTMDDMDACSGWVEQ